MPHASWADRSRYNADYRRKNREKLQKANAEWRAQNADALKEKKRAYYVAHREELIAKSAARHAQNRDSAIADMRARYARNRDVRVAQVIAYERDRMKEDPQFKLRKLLRKAQRRLVNGHRPRGGRVLEVLGCTIPELQRYIENLWQPGMSWQNWTSDGWHLDHIKPLTAFDLTNPDQFAEAFHYTNLQPLWAADNIRKGGYRG